MSNLSIFQRNTLDCFCNEESQTAYLWAIDHSEEKKAFEYANEIEYLTEFLKPFVKDPDLLLFLLKRHKYYRFPNSR